MRPVDPGSDRGEGRRPGRPEPPPRRAGPRTSARYAVTGDREAIGRRPERGEGDDEGGPRARPARRRKGLAPAAAVEVHQAGPPREVARLEARLQAATRAYERDRYGEALPIVRELSRAHPGVAAVRELHGLTLYRLGRWREAARELRQFAELAGSVDQHPVIADCERALGHHGLVVEVWNELRRAGAGSDVLTEGRLVMAGSLADRGRAADAIALLEPAAGKSVRKPLERHVRQWYVLADLYERSGEVVRARELFRRVVAADPETSDAAERLAALR